MDPQKTDSSRPAFKGGTGKGKIPRFLTFGPDSKLKLFEGVIEDKVGTTPPSGAAEMDQVQCADPPNGMATY